MSSFHKRPANIENIGAKLHTYLCEQAHCVCVCAGEPHMYLCEYKHIVCVCVCAGELHMYLCEYKHIVCVCVRVRRGTTHVLV